ncbi:MAG: M23 family metallopeptidase [Pseudomonadota bacterium]
MGHKMVLSALYATTLLVVLVQVTPARADGPPFDLPVECPTGQCDVVHYVDHDTGPGARDFACGTSTYNDHRGTDFAIADEAAMIEGIAVQTIAAGTIAATRDGVEDIDAGRIPADTLDGIECGNGILVDHGDGWQSQYCHLRRGSVAVRKGDEVERGQMIGLIGMSGKATFPHLHFNLRHDGVLIDPFSGTNMGDADPAQCNTDQTALWTPDAAEQMTYRPISLYKIGFSSARPNATDIKRGYGRRNTLPVTSPELYFWGYLIGAQNGDLIRLDIEGPNGFDGGREFVVELPATGGLHAKMYHITAPRPDAGWTPGTYQGRILFSRKGSPHVEIGVADLVIGDGS